MGTKITVNGVSYDSVETMPAEARRMYEQALARLPDLARLENQSATEMIERGGALVRQRTIVRKKFIVNGREYDDLDAMPPDDRQAYDKSMQGLSTGNATVTKNEIKLSFSVTGPGLHFGRTSSSSSTASPGPQLVPGSTPDPMAGLGGPAPIEPDSMGGGRRMALIVLLFAGFALALWVYLRTH